MITPTRFVLLLLVFAAMPVVAHAQTPQIVVQAASPANPSAAGAQTSVATMQGPGSSQAALKLLQEIKASNAETLKKQEATLQLLDEIQKAADQIKIFSHRD